MRMLILATAILLCIIIGWALLYNLSISEAVKYFNVNGDALEELIWNNDFEIAKVEIEKIVNQWEKYESLWIFFMHQEEIEEIINSVTKLEKYIKAKDKIFSIAELENIRMILKLIEGNEKLSIENIF